MSVLHGDFISDGGIVWRAEDTRLYGYIADIPNFYERESLFSVTVSDRTKIITPSRLLVNINNHGYIAEESYSLNINSTSYYDSSSINMASAENRAGKDIYIYAIEKNGLEIPGFILSTNSTVPTGYNRQTSRKIGGFHCLCEDVGPIAGHPISNYAKGDIIPYSIWDLKHRPIANPEGMNWIEGIGKWVDIYLNSWNGNELVSEFNGTIADGAINNNQSWSGEKFVEYLGKIGKTLPTREEFMVFAKSGNERFNITGSVDPVTTGGHMDSNNTRIISNYALEDCTGVMNQWTSTTHEYFPGTTYNLGEHEFTGYDYQRAGVFNEFSDAASLGQYKGILRRVYVGGSWNAGLVSGSRSGGSDLLSSNSNIMIGCRGVSMPKVSA